MNNKGQTLVIFIILLPIVLILFAYVIDKCYLLYQEKELKDIANIACEYTLNKHTFEDTETLILENDKDIENIKINNDLEKSEITLEKKVKSFSSKLLGKDFYQIKVKVNCIE